MNRKEPVSREEAAKLASDAYIYGYPLVIMDVTRRVTTCVPKPEGTKVPVNQISHLRAFPDYTFTDVVSPNADTLYSFAWLHLSQEPMILSVPAANNRYYLMQMLDAWTNVFASVGTRTTGSSKANFAVVGPRWTSHLPAGVVEIRAPSNMVWMIGRTQTNGKKDYPTVHAIQDQYHLTPLSSFGKPYTPPKYVPVESGIDAQTPPVEQVARMDAATFFARLNALMNHNPPAAADASALERFAKIGVAPGAPFDLNSMDQETAKGIEQGAREGLAQIRAQAKKPHGTKVNGWNVLPSNTAAFGTDYVWRAVVALVGLGANLPADAIYPHATIDADSQPLTGAHQYRVRFPKGQLPPVNAFWSLTMYNTKQAFVQNPIDRYAIGDRDELTSDADGAVTLYLQHDSPGKDKESNWLPAPSDAFNVFMRLYWPKQEILDGTWKIPPIERVK
jgi:hypothetical protein